MTDSAVEEFKLDVSTRACFFVAGHFILFYWMRYVVAPSKPGLPRFARALALLPVLWFMGNLFDGRKKEESIATLYCVNMFLVSMPLKLCSFCMNRGPIVKAYDLHSTSAFVVSFLFPVSIEFGEKKVSHDAEEKTTKQHVYKDARFTVVRFEKGKYWTKAVELFVQIILKHVLMVALRFGRYYFDDIGQPFWRNMCVGWFCYAISSAIEDLASLIILFTLNMKLKSNFDRPWLSQSIRELWSCRYNLVIGEILRNVAFEPVYEGCWVRGTKYFATKKPSKFRKSMALVVTFIVSCFFHILSLRFFYPFKFSFAYGAFFLANGVVILFEDFAKSIVSSRKGGTEFSKSIPSWIFRIYALSVVFVLGHFTFCRDFVKFGYADTLIDGALAFLPLQ